MESKRSQETYFLAYFISGLIAINFAAPAQAADSNRDKAYRMHSRLASVPPEEPVLDEMAKLLERGDALSAAFVAIKNPNFYNITIKHWVTPWSNKQQTSRAPLNDFVATVIGMARDNLPFDQILYGDIIYTGGALITDQYSPTDNKHYANLEAQGTDLFAILERNQQSILNPAVTDVSGALTTRAFGEAFLRAGTNRAAVRFSLLNFLCYDLEQLHDTTISDFRIRRDVERQPGGDPNLFKNKCAGCHAGMDALAGAFAYFDWDKNFISYTNGQVALKYSHNKNNFSAGHVTIDDSWINLWNEGQNSRLGWRGPKEGRGVQSYGKLLAGTDAFPLCMAKRAVNAVCKSDFENIPNEMLQPIAAEFKESNYSLKHLFAATASKCLEE